VLRRDKKYCKRFCYSANVAVLREQKWLAALKSCQNHCWLYASGTLLNKCIGDDTKAAARQSLNCIKNKRNSNMAKNDFQYGGWNSYTLQCGVWLWNRDSKFIQWQHPAMWYVVLGWHAIEFAWWQHPAMWHVALESCHWIRPNVRHIGILYLISISTTSSQSTCHCAPVSEILSKSDHSGQKKMASCRFSRWRISAILDFRNPIMGSLKSPIKIY